ncbi:hypothetical protein NC651_024322 [Populus alba x Populus x berolinensis]|nr:hypothetical protein NC651_024320 [Populus alba x Populus x berolinensis]KAJ6890775.1 hypothetical protein NC651_024322 [Populus alba x Populus x berolinensis]
MTLPSLKKKKKKTVAKNSKFEVKRRKGNQDTDNKELNDDTDSVINKKTSNQFKRKRKAKGKAEEELSNEDLVSIAEEYVKVDEDSRKKQTSSRERKLQRQLTTATSSKHDLEDSLIVPDDEHISASCETLLLIVQL